MRFLFSFLLLTALIQLQSCAMFRGDPTENWTAKQFYDEASKAMYSGEFESAIQNLETLEARFPFDPYAKQAQLDIAYSYYKFDEPDAAIGAADRFMRLHPRDPNIDYVYYLKGLVNFRRGTGVLDGWFPRDQAEHETETLHNSFNDFATLVRRYPDSKYAGDAYQRMIYLRNNMAEYEIHVADYYMRRQAYIAAANRGKYVIENYQRTPSVPTALVIMVRAYRELGAADLEAARRAVGMRPFDVQIMGGWAMIRGMIAEMQTGEGKTLTATLPACTAALAGIPVHVITVNEYLVERDAQAMSPLYRALGLTVGYVTQSMVAEERRAGYACDITYCTNKQVAFDYLRDRLLLGNNRSHLRLQLESAYAGDHRLGKFLLRGLCFAIVDEADSVLVDEAGMVDVRQMRRVLEHAQENGAKVVLVGDPDQLKAIGANTKGIIEESGRLTTKKTRIIAEHQQVLRIDREPTGPLPADSVGELARRLALREGEIEVCFGELADRVLSLSAALRSRGVEPGDCVVVAGRRSADIVTAILAVMPPRIGPRPSARLTVTTPPVPDV